jgi:anti-anti-sigma factor
VSGDGFTGRLGISVTEQNGAVVISAEGEVDLDNAEQLATALRSAAAESRGRPVVLDLLAVPFMDSSGLKTLLVASGELDGRLVLAITPGSPVETLLQLAEVRNRFTVHDTADDAIRAHVGNGS